MNVKILKRLTNNCSNNKKLFAFDVETSQTSEINENSLHYKNQKFLMGSVAIEGSKTRSFWDKDEMKDFLLSRTTRKSMIFATNLDFDFNMLFEKDPRFKNALFVEKNSVIHVKCKQDNNYWLFYDTLCYTKAGVEALGKMLKINKLPHPKCFKYKPKTFEEKIELQKYCENDAEISLKFAEYFKAYCNMLKMKMKITIASTGLDYWRRHHQPHDLFQERRAWIDKHYEGSFKGGRTEVFKRGFFEIAHGYDFKSMYPSVCDEGTDKQGSYPDPNSAHFIKPSAVAYINDFEGISKVDVECEYMYIPLLGIKTIESKLIFPIGSFTGWFTHIELRKAVEVGYRIKKVYETVYYTKNFVPFKEAVSILYNLRKKFTQEGNSIMKQLVKDQMNAGIFGKFAQKINEKSEMFTMDDIMCDEKGFVYVMKNHKRKYLENYTERGNYVFNKIKDPKSIPLFIFPILSSYTTAMARIKLWDLLQKFPKEVIYTDTDSAFLTRKRFGDSQELGELEYLGKFNDALFMKPKQYCLNDGQDDIFKVKGIPRRFIKDRDHFINVSKGIKIKMFRFTKIKESGIRKLPYGSIIDIEKGLSIEDDKRIWPSKFDFEHYQDSKPIKVNEFKDFVTA